MFPPPWKGPLDPQSVDTPLPFKDNHHSHLYQLRSVLPLFELHINGIAHIYYFILVCFHTTLCLRFIHIVAHIIEVCTFPDGWIVFIV